ncbi:MAG: tRNA (adenosine(37)-N6)-dimethylallyltransferase MiaA [Planctomycetota bacterium]
MSDRLFVLTGPTAAGKKRVAVEIAAALGAEIVSLDSMKVYRGMDVGTDKWPPALAVPVHLVDQVDANQPFSLGRYLHAAARVVGELRGRGREALFVGGTGLYLKGLVHGLFAGPAANPELRARLHQEIAALGLRSLFERLRECDPDAAARLNANDARRIVRALEVHELTGQPISVLWRTHTRRAIDGQLTVVGLRYERAFLRERIEARVEAMFAGGLVDECARIRAGVGFCAETASAIGYREALACLAGELTLAQAIAAAKLSTWQFARRQETWFRQFPEIRWVAVGRSSRPEEIVSQAIAHYRR